MSNTSSKIVLAVRSLAEEQPDFRYSGQPGYTEDAGCSYTHANLDHIDGVGCIVGQALVRAGVTTFGELVEYENAQDGQSRNVREVYVDHTDWFDDTTAAERKWLLRVQGEQDTGKSWAESVEYADQYIS